VQSQDCSDDARWLAKPVIIEIKVSNLAKKAIVVFSALCVSAVLLLAAVVNCAQGLLTDQRVNVSRELLNAGISFIPNSASLNARLAEAEMGDEDRDILTIESRARRAVNSSPWDYRNRLLLATIQEAEGDRAAAEQSTQEALALAPNYTEVHWRLANLLLREGKLTKSIAEFRAANSSNPSLLPGTLDLLWRVSGGNIAPVQAVTPRDPKAQLLLAQFLLTQSRASDAITLFSGIDRNALVAMPEISTFIDSLMSGGRLDEARGLWVGLVGGIYAQPGHPLPGVWNGGFESDIAKNLAQFDWTLKRNEYAVPIIDSSTSHTGSRSLRIDFTGRDTARLEGQVKQTIILRPGTRYRLECYVRAERLETPEGPRIVVADGGSSTEIATSDPLRAGSSDWRPVTLDFTAPANSRAAVVTIKRIPKYSYDNPTRGTIWLDDFVLTELSNE
jgi:tetratricopeptide (TPR) repeat protein